MSDQMVTLAQLRAIMSHAAPAVVEEWHPPLVVEMRASEIVTDPLQAAFLASVANETGGLTRFDEMSYVNTPWSRIGGAPDAIFRGVRGLTEERVNAWRQLGRHGFDVAFFNHVYADSNRGPGYGLGNTQPGDGYRYRGMGPNQLTGLGNYTWMARETGLPLVEDPESIKTPATGAKISAHFWRKNGCNARASDGSEAGFLWAMKKLNAGLRDFSHHLAYWRRATAVLANDALGDAPQPLPAGKLQDDVRAVQAALVKRGFDTDGIDGIAGPKTRAAIAAFERAAGLPSDGVVDGAMLRALGLAA